MAAFEPVKATHFSTASTSHTPARDGHAGFFPVCHMRAAFSQDGSANTALQRRLDSHLYARLRRMTAPSIRSQLPCCPITLLPCCLVSDACLCRMYSHLLVSMSAARSQIELIYAIYSVCTASPNIQPDLLNPVATGDGQRYRKRSPLPTRWMSPSKTSLRIPQLPRRPAKSL